MFHTKSLLTPVCMLAFLGHAASASAESRNPEPGPSVPRSGSDPAPIGVITELARVAAKPTIFETASFEKPLVLKSTTEAAKVFGKEALAKLEKHVDFGRQTVLVFAWRGSGQDGLMLDVPPSSPAQVAFIRTPGRTRDLRPHVHVFALRNNVKWTTR